MSAYAVPDFSRLWAEILLLPPEQRRQAAIDLGRRDFDGWVRLHFGKRRYKALSPFHEHARDCYLASVAEPIDRRIGQKHCHIAPRESAKTEHVTFLHLIHAAIYGLERYVVIYASTARQAIQRARNIRDELLDNEVLAGTYGPDLVDKVTAEGAFTIHGKGGDVRVEAYGMRDATRGLNWEGWRPSRICLDDVEDDQEATSLSVRQMIRSKYRRVVSLLGGPYTNFTAVGTVIYPDSLLVELSKAADYHSQTWRSLDPWPERLDLWGECRVVYERRENPRRLADAKAFYKAHKADMDGGAVVLWPEREPLFELMRKWWTLGDYAFRAEKQNEPVNPDLVVIQDEWFRYMAGDEPPEGSAIDLWVDPAFSKRHTADEAAILTTAVDPDGYYYVLDCLHGRYGPEEVVKRIVGRVRALWGRHLIRGLWVEQLPFIEDWLRAALVREGKHVLIHPLAPVKGEGPDAAVAGQPKRRIVAIRPFYESGRVFHHERLRGSQMEAQLRFPAGEHDDCADVVAYFLHNAEIPRGEKRRRIIPFDSPKEERAVALAAAHPVVERRMQEQEESWLAL